MPEYSTLHGSPDWQLGSRPQLAALVPAGACDQPTPRQGQVWAGGQGKANAGHLEGSIRSWAVFLPPTYQRFTSAHKMCVALMQNVPWGGNWGRRSCSYFSRPPTASQSSKPLNSRVYSNGFTSSGLQGCRGALGAPSSYAPGMSHS